MNKQKIKYEIKTFIIAAIVIFGFRTVFFEPYRVPTGSMIPSIMIGDFLIVNKMSYGFKVPFSEWGKKPIYLFKYDSPKIGDIIVFKYPKNESINYIKRVVAGPGDKIKIVNKEVYINDTKMNLNQIDKEKSTEIISDLETMFNNKNNKLKVLSTTTGNVSHDIMWNDSNKQFLNMNEIIVPDDNYFVMGDNRDFSADSRFWGFVPFDNIKGKATLVWFSLSAPFFGDTADGIKMRPSRIGTSL